MLGGADIAQLVPAFVEHAIEARGVTRDERCTKLKVRCAWTSCFGCMTCFASSLGVSFSRRL